VPNNTANLTVFFAHSGSASVKAALRTLMILSPCRQIFNLLSYLVIYHLGCYKWSFLPGKGAAKYLLVSKCAVNQKKVEKCLF
jgi:hypothetical protein